MLHPVYSNLKFVRHCLSDWKNHELVTLEWTPAFTVLLLWNHSYSLWSKFMDCQSRILLASGDFISWVIGLLHYKARQFITLLNVRGCKFVGNGNLRNPPTLNPL